MAGEAPGYIGVLNAIASAEACGEEVFGAWARLTPDPELREVLEIITGKEREHAFSFRRHVRRLGFEPQEIDLPGMQAFRDLFTSPAKSDVEKLAWCCPADGGEPFGLDRLSGNPGYDDDTRHLVDLFVTEERETLRWLREEYERVQTAAHA